MLSEKRNAYMWLIQIIRSGYWICITIIWHIDLFPTIEQSLKQLYKDKMYLQSEKVLFPFVKFRTELI